MDSLESMGQEPAATGFDRGKLDCDRWHGRDVGPFVGCGGELPGLRDALDVAPQQIRPHAVGSADQRE